MKRNAFTGFRAPLGVPRLLSAALLIVTIPLPIRAADAIAEAARNVLSQWQDAVPTVRLVTKQRTVVSGREMDRHEQTSETIALIIDSTGLAIISLYRTDPWESMSSRLSGEDRMQFKWETEITGAEMIMADGTEIAAGVVMRDKDLDLLFIRPVTPPSETPPFVDLHNSSRLEVLDRLVLLGRLGRAAGRAPSVTLCRIQAVVERPRRFYVPEPTALMSGLGTPAFGTDGKILGVLLMRIMPAPGGTTSDMPIILPAAEILKVKEQIASPGE